MDKSIFWLIATLMFAALAGPAAFVATHINAADPADLYLSLGIDKTDVLAFSGARKVGPEDSLLTQVIYAPPEARMRLLEAGYALLPFGAMAELCGIGTDPEQIQSGAT